MERWREEARPRVPLARWIPRYVTREIKGPAIMFCEIDRVLFTNSGILPGWLGPNSAAYGGGADRAAPRAVTRGSAVSGLKLVD